jgi:DMSO reductase family type II enzyme heme b subunit
MDIERFADAACVMVPATDGERATYPALMMGDKDAPVSLYYWDAARGFERLRAAGRGSTEPTGESFPGAARRTAGGWEVVLELPAPAPRTPLAFAFWDGERQQRAGLKYFSTWYEVGP